jgi:hypothetical protein
MGGAMSSITISGDTSGSIILQAPAISGSTTLTLPTTSGTVLTSASTTMPAGSVNQAAIGTNVAGTGPAFSVRNNANQTLNNNTYYKVAFQVEEFDTNNNFDNTTNYRFTPTVAGYYQINAQAKVENNSNAGTLLCTIYKNGTDYKEAQNTIRAGSNTSAGSSAVVYFNGSTDYVEVYVLQSTGATATLISNGTLATWFNGAMVRGA